ncbi:MAG: hypothetical protein FWB93_00750 [Oscillospiraceae bacterium]|nr:hypothetical protein [Oscillospiraceae bacterium]
MENIAKFQLFVVIKVETASSLQSGDFPRAIQSLDEKFHCLFMAISCPFTGLHGTNRLCNDVPRA